MTDIEAELDRMRTPAIAPLLDLFPSLRGIPSWLPGGGYRKHAARYRQLQSKLWDRLRDHVKAQVVSNFVCPILRGSKPQCGE